MSKNDRPNRPSAGNDRPAPNRPRLWVGTFSPQTTAPVRLVCLNSWIHGFWTHYIVGASRKDDRTKPCFRDHPDLGGCPYCSKVANRKWKGYLGVHVVTMRRPVILEITEGCWDKSPELRRLDGELRGWQFTVRRERDSNRSPMRMDRDLTLLKDCAFGKVDVLSVLGRIWNVDFAALASASGVDDGSGGYGNAVGTDAGADRAEAEHQPAPAPPLADKRPELRTFKQRVLAEFNGRAHKSTEK